MTTGLAGVLRSSLVLVARLQAKGHRVIYACPIDARASVEERGLEYRQLDPLNFDPAPQLEPQANSRLRHKWLEWRSAKVRRKQGVAALGMKRLQAVLDEVQPELVLIDVELHEHIALASRFDTRIALLQHFFAHSQGLGLPPLQAGIRPGQGLAGSALGIRWAWLRTRLAWRRQRLRIWLRYFGTDRESVLLHHAREQDFPMDRVRRGEWVTGLTYRAIPSLHMTAVELDFPHSPPAEAQHVGPMLDLAQSPRNGEESGILRQLAAEAKASGRSLVFASVSTMGPADHAWIARLIEAARSRPAWVLALSLGGTSPEDLGLDPANNVYAFAWLNSTQALAHADVAIVHGGIRTLHECIACGVPILVRSGRQFDQDGNAARIAFHGLGDCIDPKQSSASELADRVDALLADGDIRSRIQTMSRCLDRYGEEEVLERAIGELLQTLE